MSAIGPIPPSKDTCHGSSMAPFGPRLLLVRHGELTAVPARAGRVALGWLYGGLLPASIVGLRLRYEFTREFAPYIGVVYGRRLGQTARLAAQDGDPATQIRFVFGIRSWF